MSAFAGTVDGFREAVSGPPLEVPLGRAALLIAQAEYPQLDIDRYERRLQELGTALRERLRERTGADDPPTAQLRTANELLFSELGYHGDEQRHDALSNLFLNDVLELRAGIPVTLAIIYIEVCQRAGLDVHGVGLPGHVVARMAASDGDHVYIDVARGGNLLTGEDCFRLVRELYGRRLEFREHLLSAITPRQLLQRLLRGLKARALQGGDEERAARAIDLLLTMYPWDLDELRDRGMLRERLGDYPSALDDLQQYVRYRAKARDIQTVSEAVQSLRRHISADGS